MTWCDVYFLQAFPCPRTSSVYYGEVKEWLTCLSRFRYKRRHRGRKIMLDVEIQQPVSQNLCGDSYPQTKYSESATSKILRQSEYYRVREYIYPWLWKREFIQLRPGSVPWFFRSNEYGSHRWRTKYPSTPNVQSSLKQSKQGTMLLTSASTMWEQESACQMPSH